jgi:hypothetical protein
MWSSPLKRIVCHPPSYVDRKEVVSVVRIQPSFPGEVFVYSPLTRIRCHPLSYLEMKEEVSVVTSHTSSLTSSLLFLYGL